MRSTPGLNLPDVRCEGGLETFMVSSGGNLYPCSNYAYFPSGKQRNKGVNLISDDLYTIRKFVKHKYARFNTEMRLLGTQKFTTCQNCKYAASCAPCPLANPPGIVPECEWVKSQAKKLNDKILHSQVQLPSWFAGDGSTSRSSRSYTSGPNVMSYPQSPPGVAKPIYLYQNQATACIPCKTGYIVPKAALIL